ncbi:MAG: histone deacetylase family protein [Actinobacteria bacterium]|nr:histone deacetylase family protein [Actinomycetota bacterium]
MKVVYHPDHAHHDTPIVTWVGVPIHGDEPPARMELVRDTLAGLGHEIVTADAHDDTILQLVHDPDMVEYMRTAHAEWQRSGYQEDPGQPNVTAYAFPTEKVLHGLPLRRPRSRAALAGVWAMDTTTPIGPGTFRGARAAVDMAQTAAELVLAGAPSAYAACRPPGHHAGRGFFGGSCYLNNAAVATETLIHGGVGKVAVVDLDAHHGNGSQEIFWRRGDVFYGSVHVDPAEGWFPHFVGFADETGADAGIGCNLNVPVAPGSGDDEWLAALDRLIEGVSGFGPDVVVVSLGVDAAVTDENSPTMVTGDGYRRAGGAVATLGRPTVLVQEGGYDLETIGGLVAAALDGFEKSSA